MNLKNMKSKLLLKCAIISLCLNGIAIKAQDITIKTEAVTVPEKSMVLKFSSYSVEVDKQIQKNLKDSRDFKIVYTCIPAGLVVVEAATIFDDPNKTKLETQLNKTGQPVSVHYEILEGFTTQQAEESCAAKRNIQN
jgi:hypothetical protein